MHRLKVNTIGHSLAITIPKELAARLKLDKGDEVFVRDTPEGFIVSPYDPDFAEALKAAEAVGKQYRNALRTLARK